MGKERSVPQDFKDVILIPIFKNKRNFKECGNYRGISLLATAAKILAKVVQKRLSKLAENILIDSQEKAIEQRKCMYITFIDFSKAFDSVGRRTLWKVLKAFGHPDTLIDLTRAFHGGMLGVVQVRGKHTKKFLIQHGTKQGCVLAPNLFTIFLTVVLIKVRAQD